MLTAAAYSRALAEFKIPNPIKGGLESLSELIATCLCIDKSLQPDISFSIMLLNQGENRFMLICASQKFAINTITETHPSA